jgi:hypothetical protein
MLNVQVQGGFLSAEKRKDALQDVEAKFNKGAKFEDLYYSIKMSDEGRQSVVDYFKKLMPGINFSTVERTDLTLNRNYDLCVIENVAVCYITAINGYFARGSVTHATFADIRSMIQNRFNKTVVRRKLSSQQQEVSSETVEPAKFTPFIIKNSGAPNCSVAAGSSPLLWSINCLCPSRYAYLAYFARHVHESGAAEHYVIDAFKKDLTSCPIWIESQTEYEALVAMLIYYQIDVDIDSLCFIGSGTAYRTHYKSRDRKDEDLYYGLSGYCFFMACLKGIKKELAQHISQGWSSIEVK